MPQERILGIMRDEIGTAFDGDCVAALQSSLERDATPPEVALPV
jgi:hypothetical protein